MPNHVHILLAPQAPLRKITQFVKGKSAREINLLLGLSGKYLWQKESFDHWVRSPAEFDRTIALCWRSVCSALVRGRFKGCQEVYGRALLGFRKQEAEKEEEKEVK